MNSFWWVGGLFDNKLIAKVLKFFWVLNLDFGLTILFTLGGWPEHVRTEMVEHKNKFIRQTCKEDMFKWTVTGLIKKTETILKQNNTMNIEEIYFEDMKVEEGGNAQSLTVKTLAKFKDYSQHRRPVSCISWKYCVEPQVCCVQLYLPMDK